MEASMADVKVKSLVKKYGGMAALHSIKFDVSSASAGLFNLNLDARHMC
jgi:hypothetical protein